MIIKQTQELATPNSYAITNRKIVCYLAVSGPAAKIRMKFKLRLSN